MMTYKRLAAIALAALLTVSAASCSNGVPGERELRESGWEFQKNMHQSGDTVLTHACETGEGIYFQWVGRLYYIDKGTKTATVLCGKPDCDHRGLDCDAYMNAAAMWFAGGRLYCVKYSGGREVVSVKPNGSARRTDQELGLSAGCSPSSYAEPIYHRGKVYYMWDDVLYSAPLGGGEGEAVWGAGEGGKAPESVTLWADGDSVYLMADALGADGMRRDTLFALDAAGEVRQVWATPDGEDVGSWTRTGVAPSQWYVLDGYIYFFLAGNGLWRCCLDGGENERLADTTERVPYGVAAFSDEFVCVMGDAAHAEGPGDTLYVYSLDGSLEKELPLGELYEDMGELENCAPVIISGEEVYLEVTGRTKAGDEVQRLCCVNIDTGETAQIYNWS